MNKDGSILPRSKAQVQDKFLKFKPTGMSVEEAKAAMLAKAEPVELSRENRVQGKVPQFIQNAREREAYKQHTGPSGGTTQITPEPAERGTGGSASTHVANDAHARVDATERQPEPEPTPEPKVEIAAPTPPVVAERQPQAAPTPPARSRVEDEHRIIEIYNNGREWIADIKYKNGREPERFKARSKDELIIKMADGKARATLKITALNRRIAIGSAYDTWDSYFARMKKDYGYDAATFEALSEQTKNMVRQAMMDEDSVQFMAAYPNYYATSDNLQAFYAYLNKHNIPWTNHNIQIAYEDLLAQDAMDLRPAEEIVTEEEPEAVASNANPTPAPLPVASTPVPVVPAPVAIPTVEPVAEIPAPAPVTPVRKRGSTGLIPGSSSAVPMAPIVAEETGNEPRTPSTKELKSMDIKELRRAAIPSLNRPSVRR